MSSRQPQNQASDFDFDDLSQFQLSRPVDAGIPQKNKEESVGTINNALWESGGPSQRFDDFSPKNSENYQRDSPNFNFYSKDSMQQISSRKSHPIPEEQDDYYGEMTHGVLKETNGGQNQLPWDQAHVKGPLNDSQRSARPSWNEFSSQKNNQKEFTFPSLNSSLRDSEKFETNQSRTSLFLDELFISKPKDATMEQLGFGFLPIFPKRSSPKNENQPKPPSQPKGKNKSVQATPLKSTRNIGQQFNCPVSKPIVTLKLCQAESIQIQPQRKEQQKTKASLSAQTQTKSSLGSYSSLSDSFKPQNKPQNSTKQTQTKKHQVFSISTQASAKTSETFTQTTQDYLHEATQKAMTYDPKTHVLLTCDDFREMSEELEELRARSHELEALKKQMEQRLLIKNSKKASPNLKLDEHHIRLFANIVFLASENERLSQEVLEAKNKRKEHTLESLEKKLKNAEKNMGEISGKTKHPHRFDLNIHENELWEIRRDLVLNSDWGADELEEFPKEKIEDADGLSEYWKKKYEEMVLQKNREILQMADTLEKIHNGSKEKRENKSRIKALSSKVEMMEAGMKDHGEWIVQARAFMEGLEKELSLIGREIREAIVTFKEETEDIERKTESLWANIAEKEWWGNEKKDERIWGRIVMDAERNMSITVRHVEQIIEGIRRFLK